MLTFANGGRAGSGSVAEAAATSHAGLVRPQDAWAIKDPLTNLSGEWATNYGSLREHEEQVIGQYKEEISEDLMEVISLGEAIDRYAENLLIVATGAIAKKGGGERRARHLRRDARGAAQLRHSGSATRSDFRRLPTSRRYWRNCTRRAART